MNNTAYSLSLIARSGPHFAGFGPYVTSLAADGTLAFTASLRKGASAVLADHAGTLFSLAESGHEGLGAIISHPAINQRGECCFYAELEGGGQTLCLTRDGELRKLAQTDAKLTGIGPLGPTLNDAGQVAFRAQLTSGQSAIFRADQQGLSCLATSGERFKGFQGLPVIAKDGSVLFRADLPNGEGIYLAEGTELKLIAETGEHFKSLGRFPSLSEDGTVFFSAELNQGGEGIFRAHAGQCEMLYRSDQTFTHFRGVLPAPNGACLFYATLDDGRLGIFTGPDPLTDCLLLIGETCYGGIVSDFALNRVSINPSGQVALSVKLDHGTELILRADPQPAVFRLEA